MVTKPQDVDPAGVQPETSVPSLFEKELYFEKNKA